MPGKFCTAEAVPCYASFTLALLQGTAVRRSAQLSELCSNEAANASAGVVLLAVPRSKGRPAPDTAELPAATHGTAATQAAEPQRRCSTAPAHPQQPSAAHAREEAAQGSAAECSPVPASQKVKGMKQNNKSLQALSAAECSPVPASNCSLVYGHDSCQMDTLLPGYVSRPHPSPVNRLLQHQQQRAMRTAPGSRRALQFGAADADGGHVVSSDARRHDGGHAQQQPDGRMGADAGCAHRQATGASTATAVLGSSHNRNTGWQGYGSVEAEGESSSTADATAHADPGDHISGCSRASAGQQSQKFLASLHAELDTGALQNAPARQPGSASGDERTTCTDRNNACARAADAYETRGTRTGRKRKATKSGTPAASEDDHALVRLALSSKVPASAQAALCTLPLPESLAVPRRVFAALAALYGWLQTKHVQVSWPERRLL